MLLYDGSVSVEANVLKKNLIVKMNFERGVWIAIDGFGTR